MEKTRLGQIKCIDCEKKGGVVYMKIIPYSGLLSLGGTTINMESIIKFIVDDHEGHKVVWTSDK